MSIRLALMLLLLGVAPVWVSAQPFAFPLTPEPAACTVEPLTTDQLSGLYDVDEPDAVERVATEGTPGDESLAAAVDVVIMSIACSNANQPRAALALTTDHFLASHFWSEMGQDEVGHLIAASSRDPEPAREEDRLSIELIDGIVVYDDNAIGIDVVTGNASSTYRDHIILIEQSTGWLIDEVVAGDETRRATPEAIASLLPKP